MLENVKLYVPKSGKAVVMHLIHRKRDGSTKTVEKSGDITLDIASALALKLSIDAKKRKDHRGYAGFDIPNIGKIVLFLPGYEFRTKKSFDVKR